VLERVLGDGVLPMTDPLEVTARLTNAAEAARALTALAEAGIDVAGFSVGNPSLDEVFLALTGRPADDTAAEVTS
jgi:ABC-2 type transport system ATP-binding protein